MIKLYPIIIICFFVAAIKLTAQGISWTAKKPLHVSVRNGSAASCNGKIYFMGGYCNSTPERFEKSNYEYNPSTDNWKQKKDIPTGRSNFTLVNSDNNLYAIGGDPFSDKNEMYDPQKDTWTNLAPLPTPRQHVYGTVLDGKIYIIGGLQQNEDSDLPSQWSYKNVSAKNEVYDIATDQWMEKIPMPTPRHDSHSISVNDKIYVIGGMGTENDIWKTLSVVEMYDPATDKWETKTNLPEPRDGFGMFAVGKKIFIVGGFNGEAVVKSVFVYDTEKDTWSEDSDFPNEKNGAAGAASIDNKIYMIGGCDKKYNSYPHVFEGIVDTPNYTYHYLGLTPPGKTARIFAPEIIKHLAHSSPTFSPDGKEMYWSTVSEEGDTRKIYYVKYENSRWSEPMVASFSGNYHDDQPFITHDGKKLYFASKRPKEETNNTDNDIWVSERTSQGWNTPKPIDNLIGFWTPSLTKNGTIYFLDIILGFKSNCGIFKAEFKNGSFLTPEFLPEQINNKNSQDWCPFISPDENYLIFSSDREGGFGSGDLYICFKDKEGKWLEPINMGGLINTNKQERFPGVSPDGKYLFFTRWYGEPYFHDLYWIDADIIKDLENQIR